MNLTDFETWVRERWNVHPGEAYTTVIRGWAPPRDLTIAALGLNGEVGEVTELVKKHIRDGRLPGLDMLLELGDVLHYLTVLARQYGYSLEEVADANVAKLMERDAAKKAGAP